MLIREISDSFFCFSFCFIFSNGPVRQGRHWVLDPIDGTRGFVGMRQYAVCLGLLDQGQVATLPQAPCALIEAN